MIHGIEIRNSLPEDLPAIEELYRDAFPTEDLLPLVRELLAGRSDVLSLVATLDAAHIAHVIFTKCSVDGNDAKAALLGPLAVAPAQQKKGIGSAIVRKGFLRLKDDAITNVFVLGDPAYYGRFGFAAERNVAPPYTLPAEWKDGWQSVTLADAAPLSCGAIRLPAPWLRKELWLP